MGMVFSYLIEVAKENNRKGNYKGKRKQLTFVPPFTGQETTLAMTRLAFSTIGVIAPVNATLHLVIG